jgi:hypothetical protein
MLDYLDLRNNIGWRSHQYTIESSSPFVPIESHETAASSVGEIGTQDRIGFSRPTVASLPS